MVEKIGAMTKNGTAGNRIRLMPAVPVLEGERTKLVFSARK